MSPTLCLYSGFVPAFFSGKSFKYIKLKSEDGCSLQTGSSFKFSLSLLESVQLATFYVPGALFFSQQVL